MSPEDERHLKSLLRHVEKDFSSSPTYIGNLFSKSENLKAVPIAWIGFTLPLGIVILTDLSWELKMIVSDSIFVLNNVVLNVFPVNDWVSLASISSSSSMKNSPALIIFFVKLFVIS